MLRGSQPKIRSCRRRIVGDRRRSSAIVDLSLLTPQDDQPGGHLVRVQVLEVAQFTPARPGTGTTADNGWRMFDGDVSTATDTTTANGWVTVTPTNGTTVDVDAVRVRPRANYPARANGTTAQGSADGGASWQTLATIAGVTSDQQWSTFTLPQHASAPMIRILDEHGGNTNLAEVQLLHFDPLPW